MDTDVSFECTSRGIREVCTALSDESEDRTIDWFCKEHRKVSGSWCLSLLRRRRQTMSVLTRWSPMTGDVNDGRAQCPAGIDANNRVTIQSMPCRFRERKRTCQDHRAPRSILQRHLQLRNDNNVCVTKTCHIHLYSCFFTLSVSPPSLAKVAC